MRQPSSDPRSEDPASCWYRLDPDVDAVPLSDERLLLRSDAVSVRLAGATAILFAKRLLPRLFEGLCRAELPELIPEVPPRRLEAHLDELVRSGLLEAATDLEVLQARSRMPPSIAGLLRRSDSATAAMAKLRGLRIAVVGMDAVGAQLAATLALAGVGSLLLIDPYSRGPSARNSTGLVGADAAGRSRQQAVRTALERYGSETKILTGPEGELVREDVYAVVGDCDAVAGCFGTGFSISDHWINEAALTTGSPAVFASLRGQTVLAGPLVVPSSGGACYQCWRLRAMAAEHPALEAAAREHFWHSRRRPDISWRPLFPAAAPVAASILAQALLMTSLDVGPPTLVGHVHEFDCLSLRSFTHPVLRRPDCPACGAGPTRAGGQPVAVQEPGDILAATDLVSPRTGIVLAIEDVPRESGAPHPYVSRARSANHRLQPNERARHIGWGRGLTREEARSGALGEAIEHYCGSMWTEEDLLHAPYADLKGDALDPRRLVLYALEQYDDLPYAPFHETTTLGWVRARTLGAGEPVLVPAVACLAGYEPRRPGERILPFQVGRAAGSGTDAAVLAAALEVMERDAFLITWLNRLPCRRLDPLTHPDPEVVALCGSYRRAGIDVELYELPVDHPACVMLAFTIQAGADPGGPAVTMGLGAKLASAPAARHAILEAGMMRWNTERLVQHSPMQERMAELAADHRQTSDRVDHLLLWASPHALPVLDFLRDTPIVARSWDDSTPPNASDQLRRLVEHFRAAGHDLIHIELTTADLAAYGLSVARVVIPDFQPTHFGWGEERLGGQRLFELPRQLGLRARRTTVGELNRYPHPLG